MRGDKFSCTTILSKLFLNNLSLWNGAHKEQSIFVKINLECFVIFSPLATTFIMIFYRTRSGNILTENCSKDANQFIKILLQGICESIKTCTWTFLPSSSDIYFFFSQRECHSIDCAFKFIFVEFLRAPSSSHEYEVKS